MIRLRGLDMKYSKRIPRIGQGGMVVQRIELDGHQVQIIYDCGTSSDKVIITNEINKLDATIETILIISHFHDDHVNCVDILRNRRLNLTKVVIPHRTPEEITLAACISDDPEISGFIYSPGSYFKDATIIEIDDSEASIAEPLSLSSLSGGRYSHRASYPLLFRDHIFPAWLIRFYVRNAVFNKLTPKDDAIVQSIKTIDDVLKNRDALFVIYSKIAKSNFNHSSMMAFIFPGPIDGKFFPYHCCDFDCRSLVMCSGDLKISSKAIADKIRDHYTGLQHIITDIILPHHGGDEYFKCSPFDNLIRAYAQTGPYSVHKHPGIQTQNLLDSKTIEFYNITSDGKH